MELSISQIAEIIGGEVNGDGTKKIRNIAKIQQAGVGCISFLSNPKYEPFIYTTEATAVIVSKAFIPKKLLNTVLIKVEDPYLSFTALLEEYDKIVNFLKSGVEDPSYIGKNTTHGENIYRGAFSYIGNNVNIGNNVKIYPQVYIGDNVTIGNNCIFNPGVKIYSRTVIGNNCVFQSGVVIGSDGFGFAPQPDGSYKKIPQLGNVIIEDHVEIGGNTVIDCATMESTIINKGVKLDNLIQIAHNVAVGKNTVIAAQTGISGSAKIGENCVIGGQVGIVGHIEIGNKISIAAKTGVSKTILKEGSVLLGSIGFERKQYLRSYTIFRKLPELQERIKELEEKIINLRSI
ncbi:MAG: UDP-3-O-(3-hydroxymyristoyl)glucosamine N-acyltransferase [Bacteroidota bacterium]|nr:UDP-3-O-(3-hydroxymyristoyl)glucosamine N-acyltransferase [Bacteroidota bacterium]